MVALLQPIKRRRIQQGHLQHLQSLAVTVQRPQVVVGARSIDHRIAPNRRLSRAQPGSRGVKDADIGDQCVLSGRKGAAIAAAEGRGTVECGNLTGHRPGVRTQRIALDHLQRTEAIRPGREGALRRAHFPGRRPIETAGTVFVDHPVSERQSLLGRRLRIGIEPVHDHLTVGHPSSDGHLDGPTNIAQRIGPRPIDLHPVEHP